MRGSVRLVVLWVWGFLLVPFLAEARHKCGVKAGACVLRQGGRGGTLRGSRLRGVPAQLDPLFAVPALPLRLRVCLSTKRGQGRGRDDERGTK